MIWFYLAEGCGGKTDQQCDNTKNDQFSIIIVSISIRLLGLKSKTVVPISLTRLWTLINQICLIEMFSLGTCNVYGWILYSVNKILRVFDVSFLAILILTAIIYHLPIMDLSPDHNNADILVNRHPLPSSFTIYFYILNNIHAWPAGGDTIYITNKSNTREEHPQGTVSPLEEMNNNIY